MMKRKGLYNSGSSASGFSFYYDPWSLHACLATRQQVSDDDDDTNIEVLYADDGDDGGDDDSDDGEDGEIKPQSLHAQLVAYEWVSHHLVQAYKRNLTAWISKILMHIQNECR